MPLEPISFAPSSNIESIWHDPETQTLVVRFRHRYRVYRYPDIPGELAWGFSQSLSATGYLQQSILGITIGKFMGELPPSDNSDSAEELAAIRNLADLSG